ncbi:hypothetical protein BDW22DRAFT_379519 [Trametopsis cervina]|nr:hypothetical protein BDW22DRAFT_379519 [Trametopsis cervina]
MHSSVATPAHATTLPKPQPSSQHQYGTRIRSNSVMKPSVRLRQASDVSRRIKPVPVPKATPAVDASPADFPVFPPPHVMLHSEDATSKVFVAIGRSFMSVDNKAMTIKDLAEMTMKFGLVCQNVSAAGQAITTYIRNHIQRCEVQEDQPLLLRHILSGTPSDDDLVPALHSRSGGAHCMLDPSGDRATNFRRGTMVWYLSKAAGVPCPFARAGICLREYSENGKVGIAVNTGKERKRERDRLRRVEQCGQKRKRPVRSCAAKYSDTDSSSEEDRPAPKVKLTLRLNPLLVNKSSVSPPPSSPPSGFIDLSKNSSDSEDLGEDSMSVDSDSDSSEDSDDESCDETSWCLPPYPRTAVDGRNEEHQVATSSKPWRSPSVPSSAASASPPPDSPDEDEEMYDERPSFTMRYSSESSWPVEDDDDFFADMEDTDTQWGESPGPLSPPAQFDDEGITVKQEPRDIGSLLDSWDNIHGRVGGLKVDGEAAISDDMFKPKLEDPDSWSWSDPLAPSVPDTLSSPVAYIKREEDELSLSEYAPLNPVSAPSPHETPCTPHDSPDEAYMEARRNSDFVWKDVEILGPDSVQLHDLENGIWSLDCRRPSVQVVSTNVEVSSASEPHERDKDAAVRPPLAPEKDRVLPRPSPSSSSTPLSPDRNEEKVLLPPGPTDEHSYFAGGPEVVVHQTIQPCVPAICATELEGIPVYHMVLGSSCILRRVDTGFINITPILQFFGLEQPDLTTLPSSYIVTRGSSLICGTWTSLTSARELFQSQSLLNLFLSDNLHQQFPPSFRELRDKAVSEQALPQFGFGPHFQSTVDAKRESTSSFRLKLPQRSVGTPWELGMVQQWDVEDHLLSVHPPFALCSASLKIAPSSYEDQAPPETPLSPTEEEMFRVLCSAADWEPPTLCEDRTPTHSSIAAVLLQDEGEVSATDVTPCVEHGKEQERPLRRSRRVATTAASRPCTRSTARRGKQSHL